MCEEVSEGVRFEVRVLGSGDDVVYDMRLDLGEVGNGNEE